MVYGGGILRGVTIGDTPLKPMITTAPKFTGFDLPV